MSTDLSDQDEALMHFLYQSPVGLVQASLGGEITMMNPMAAQLLLPLASSGYATNLFEILNDCAPHIKVMVDNFGAGRGVICDALRLSGTRVEPGLSAPRVLAVSLLKLGDSGLMLSVSDATTETQRERAVLASQLHKAARIDALTGLPNRAAVLEKLVELKADQATTSTRFALLLIGCDRFGHVNDTYGRSVGDALLKELAKRLMSAVRHSDVVGITGLSNHTAAHLGGDEFVIVLTGIEHGEHAIQVGYRLRDLLAEPYWIDGRQFQMTVSLGMVSPDQITEGAEAEQLLQDADLALEHAKRSGRARLEAFELSMRTQATYRGRLEEELRHAISLQELFVVYQPVVDMQTQRTIGFEALVRWRHPELGLVYPQEFIAIAEETNLIRDLGGFVLEEACRSFGRWRAELGDQAPTKLSVNLSRAQLLQPDIVERVREILHRTGFDPKHLMFEITESLAAMDERVRNRLLQLKNLNVVLALDDFGTGYSSLSSLHLLPIDVIKIDKSFVNLIEESPHHQVLVEATVRVARSLGMRTIAEGIETGGQLQILKALQCDEGQGYLFSKPLHAGDVIDWLTPRTTSTSAEKTPTPLSRVAF